MKGQRSCHENSLVYGASDKGCAYVHAALATGTTLTVPEHAALASVQLHHTWAVAAPLLMS